MTPQSLSLTISIGSKTLVTDTLTPPVSVQDGIDIATEFLGREPELTFVGTDNGGKASISLVVDGHSVYAFDYALPAAVEEAIAVASAIMGQAPTLTIDVKAVAA